MKVIETVNLTKEFHMDTLTQQVLKGIDLSVETGDFAGIVGPSGSGKTTLLYCLSSLETPTSGSVFFNGKDIAKYQTADISALRKSELGFIFQFYNLIPNLTVYENVLLARIIADEDHQDIDEILKRVGMFEFKDYYPNQISGGMQQRVAIARALVNHPSVVFADEPTGNLDQKSGKDIMNLLQTLNREDKVTIVLVTHNEDYLDYCNKIFRLLDGKLL